MEGNIFRFDAQRAHGDGFLLTQKPDLLTLPKDLGSFDCNICLDPAHDPVVTLCGHLFCWPCIYRWLRVQNSSSLPVIHQQNCPVCKSNISIAALVPLYGRGMSSPSSETSMIPPRPTSSPLNNLINSASSLNPSLQHHHPQAHSPPHYGAFTANAVMMSFLYPVIGMFGDMVYTRIFGTFTNALPHPYPHTRGNNNQRMVQLDKSLHWVSIFFLCCILLCLLFF